MDIRPSQSTAAARSASPSAPNSVPSSAAPAFSHSTTSVFERPPTPGAHHAHSAAGSVTLTQPEASSPAAGPPRREVSLARYRAWQAAKCLATAMKWTIGLVSAIGLVAAGVAGGVILGGAGGVLTGSFMVTEMCVKGGFYAGAAVFLGLDWLEGKISDHLAGLVPRAESAGTLAHEGVLV